jgi:hypothetical protein
VKFTYPEGDKGGSQVLVWTSFSMVSELPVNTSPPTTNLGTARFAVRGQVLMGTNTVTRPKKYKFNRSNSPTEI